MKKGKEENVMEKEKEEKCMEKEKEEMSWRRKSRKMSWRRKNWRGMGQVDGYQRLYKRSSRTLKKVTHSLLEILNFAKKI